MITFRCPNCKSYGVYFHTTIEIKGYLQVEVEKMKCNWCKHIDDIERFEIPYEKPMHMGDYG